MVNLPRIIYQEIFTKKSPDRAEGPIVGEWWRKQGARSAPDIERYVGREVGAWGGRAGALGKAKPLYKPTISFIIFEQILGKFTKNILPRIFVANFQFTKNFLGCENEKKKV